MKEKNNLVQRLLSPAYSVVLSEKFQEKERKLQKSIKLWLRVMILSVFLLIFLNVVPIIIPFLFWYMKIEITNNLKELLIIISDYESRIAVASPLIFLITFWAFQYSKMNRYLEEYSFKTITAHSLWAFMEILENVWNRKDILDYTIKTIQDIHTIPNDKIYWNKKIKEKTPFPLYEEYFDKLKDWLKELWKDKELQGAIKKVFDFILSKIK